VKYSILINNGKVVHSKPSSAGRLVSKVF